jgi:tol-pal system protein YbgF
VGCATAPRLPGERRDAEIEQLKTRVLELSERAAVADVELARLRQQVAALEGRLAAGRAGAGQPAAAADAASPAAPAPSRGSGAARAPSRPPTAAARPAPALEESELPSDEPVATPPPRAATAPRPAVPPPEPPAATPRGTATAPPARPAAAPSAAAVPPPAPSAIAAAGDGAPVPREAQAVYDEAYTLYHQGKFPEAEARFEEFLAQAPKTELSDNAEYWIGAARFARSDFRGALAAFRRTVELYPDGNKVPDALYKMGQALEELAEPVVALAVYDELVRRFPDTAAASLASERQAKLRP